MLAAAAAVLSPLRHRPETGPVPADAAGVASTPSAAQVADLLHEFEKAVVAGDQDAARALAPEGDPAVGDYLAAVVANAQELRLDDVTVGQPGEPDEASTAGRWQAPVMVTWRIPGVDAGAAHARVTATFSTTDGRPGLVSFGADESGTPLWLGGPVVVRRDGPAVVVVADGPGAAARAERYLVVTRNAVDAVRRVLPDWRTPVAVEVPGSAAALDRVLAAPTGQNTGIAAVTAAVGDDTGATAPVHVFLNPAVFDQLRPLGARVVLSHEVTHVATDATRSQMPLWLLEGFADYVALRDVPLPVGVAAAHAVADVRRHGVPTALPDAAAFDQRGPALEVAYEQAWLACRFLAQQAGEEALVEVYRRVDHGAPVAQVLREQVGWTLPELTRQWRERLSDLAA